MFFWRFFSNQILYCCGRMDGAAEARVLRIDCHNEAKNYPLLWHSPPSLSLSSNSFCWPNHTSGCDKDHVWINHRILQQSSRCYVILLIFYKRRFHCTLYLFLQKITYLNLIYLLLNTYYIICIYWNSLNIYTDHTFLLFLLFRLKKSRT